MDTKDASEIGHAAAALMLGLIEVLADKGVLTRSDLSTVMVGAISRLESGRDALSMEGAVDFIESLLPEIRGST